MASRSVKTWAVAAARQAPYGWKATDGTLEPVVAEQAVIRRMQEMTAAGCSASEVARRLNAEGVPAQHGTWHPSTWPGRCGARPAAPMPHKCVSV